ncbi:MAG: hypothetical protein R6W97_12295 [Thiobacillus sp.]
MKIRFVLLPLLCAASVAMADGMDREVAADPATYAVAPAKTQDRAVRHRSSRLPSGDMRHCLDMKTNAAIIRCSESRRKR